MTHEFWTKMSQSTKAWLMAEYLLPRKSSSIRGRHYQVFPRTRVWVTLTKSTTMAYLPWSLQDSTETRVTSCHCVLVLNSTEDFYSQHRKQPTPDFCASKSHKAMGIGENVWFRIFSGTKSGPKWKRGVIIRWGADIEGLDPKTTVMNIYPSHHYTIWDVEMEFITSRDIHHIRPMYTKWQKADLLQIIK
jgi:hypothetical protein